MLEYIVKQFFPNHIVQSISAHGNGHINDTYKLQLKNKQETFILQRINTEVFKDPDAIADTHLQLEKQIADSAENGISIARIVSTADDKLLFTDKAGNYWRMTNFIPDTFTIDVVQHPWQAYQAGKGYGWFLKVCNKLKVSKFKEAITDFHKLSFRINQLNDAIANNAAKRLDNVKELVNFFKQREEELSEIENLTNNGKIPLRIVHNDTKINNLLFKNRQAAAVIDLDTVGPGITFFDYGDALRTGANTAVEDEKDLSKVKFNLSSFAEFTKGYLSQVKDILTPNEKKLLHKAPILLTYIMGIRFLTDYLNGDVYYKTAYPEHNLTRTLVQKTLIESMEANRKKMIRIINNEL